MQEQKSTAGQGIGVGGLILGIVAIPLAIIPCTFPLALLLATAGIILSAVGISQASKANGSKGLPVSGLVVSIIGLMIALMWGLFIAAAVHEDGKFWKNELVNKITKKVEEDMGDTFEEIDHEFEKLDQNLENMLEDLEWDKDWMNFDWGDEISEEDFEDVMDAYDDLIHKFQDFADEADEGLSSMADEFEKMADKAAVLVEKVTEVSQKLTEEQRKKFQELQLKYEDALEKLEELESEE